MDSLANPTFREKSSRTDAFQVFFFPHVELFGHTALAGIAVKGLNQSSQRLRSAVAGAILASAAGLLFVGRLGDGLADLSLDLPFRWRPNQTVGEGVVIIYQDQQSAQELKQTRNQDWDRELHASLIRRLIDCRARAIVFDVWFSGKQAGTNDQALTDALAAARQGDRPLPVILGVELHESSSAEGSTIMSPLPPLEQFASISDFGLGERGRLGEPLRRHYPGFEGTPTLAMRTAEVIGHTWKRPLASERWINYYGPPRYLPKCAYLRALDTNLTDVVTFSNKVCLVGAPNEITPAVGGTRVDEWPTPYSRSKYGLTSGVEITATVFLNLLREDWLVRLSAGNEVLLLGIVGLVIGFGLVFLRPTLACAAAVSAALVVAGAASWWMWHSYVWFSWLKVVAVQIPVSVAWSAFTYTRRITRDKGSQETTIHTQPILSSAFAPTAVQPASVSAPSGGLVPIADHTLLSCVGRGGYGEVWLARNAIGGYHAVKIVRRALFDHPEPFEREFRGLEKFMPISRRHPGLVHILHVGRREAEGFIYYVMEAADDETTGPSFNPDSYSPRNLAKDLQRRRYLPIAECLQLGLDLSDALEFLHQQRLIHRDIKPANIIFVQNKPKLADIGLVTDQASPGAAVTYLGTRGYIAPEGPGTPAADVYSLGKVLYEASMGLSREQFPELPDTLPQRVEQAELLELNKLLLKACRQDPAERYRSAAELREDLLKYQQKFG